MKNIFWENISKQLFTPNENVKLCKNKFIISVWWNQLSETHQKQTVDFSFNFLH